MNKMYLILSYYSLIIFVMMFFLALDLSSDSDSGMEEALDSETSFENAEIQENEASLCNKEATNSSEIQENEASLCNKEATNSSAEVMGNPQSCVDEGTIESPVNKKAIENTQCSSNGAILSPIKLMKISNMHPDTSLLEKRKALLASLKSALSEVKKTIDEPGSSGQSEKVDQDLDTEPQTTKVIPDIAIKKERFVFEVRK